MSSFHDGRSKWPPVAVLAAVAGLGMGIENMAFAQAMPAESREADQNYLMSLRQQKSES